MLLMAAKVTVIDYIPTV